MKNFSAPRTAISALTLTLLASATPVAAQQNDRAERSAAQIEEVVVTANRREERLQDVPIAVTAIGGELAARQGLSNTSILTTGVPGLVFNQQGNSATPFLRGVGNPSGLAGQESTVATYVDGVYIASPIAQLFNLNNIERIEVLKGPQGTLFGRNANGGVIQLITRRPTSTPTLNAEIGYGNYDTYAGSLYASTGIADGLAVDLAVIASNQRDGWGKNLTTGQDLFKEKSISARSKAVWTPTDDTSLTVAADVTYQKTSMGEGYHIAPGSFGPGGVGYAGFYNSYVSPNTYGWSRQKGVAATLDHDFGALRFLSISAYRVVDARYRVDQDAVPALIVDAVITSRSKTFTQEFQLLSPAGSDVNWILGAFYLDDDTRLLPLALRGAAFGGAAIDVFGAQKARSHAVFGQASAEVLPKTNLTVGLRYTKDKRDVAGYTLANGFNIGGASQSASFDKITWRVALDYHFTPDILGYVSQNRGFKSGIFNTLVFTDPAVRPEILDAYEAGLKTQLLDRRLQFNVAAFYYDYKDIQVNTAQVGNTRILNAAAATIKGLDIDFVLVATERLRFTGGANLLRGRYDKFPDAPYYLPDPSGAGGNILAGAGTCPPGHPFTGGGCDASGNRTVRSPKLTMNLGADYRIETSAGEYDITGNFYHNSGFKWDSDNRLTQKRFNVVNLSAGWRSADKTYSIRLWSQNLFNTKYRTILIEEGLGDHGSPAAPRTFGVKVGMSLGGDS